MFGKAIKTKFIKGFGKIKYFDITKERKPTKRTLKFDLIQINAYEELLGKYPERKEDYHKHLVFLYAVYAEDKKLINKKYQLTNIERFYSLCYLKQEYLRLKEIVHNHDVEADEKIRRVEIVDKIIKDHFSIVWNITDEYFITPILQFMESDIYTWTSGDKPQSSQHTIIQKCECCGKLQEFTFTQGGET